MRFRSRKSLNRKTNSGKTLSLVECCCFSQRVEGCVYRSTEPIPANSDQFAGRCMKLKSKHVSNSTSRMHVLLLRVPASKSYRASLLSPEVIIRNRAIYSHVVLRTISSLILYLLPLHQTTTLGRLPSRRIRESTDSLSGWKRHLYTSNDCGYRFAMALSSQALP